MSNNSSIVFGSEKAKAIAEDARRAELAAPVLEFAAWLNENQEAANYHLSTIIIQDILREVANESK